MANTVKFQIYRGKDLDYYWRLVAGNGQTIATGGEGYVTKNGCKEAVQRIQDYASDAIVEEI